MANEKNNSSFDEEALSKYVKETEAP